ncbi:MAG: LysR substrate-binding domain-containing protein [Rhodobacterales bacterium]|nr:LysR substrate-binding domain-containing protein [Rhodobacterales bacterium]
MRYVQLRAFHNVAIYGGFSRAAEALHLTQPAISDQVKKLEEEYDIRLFDRQKRRVVVTEKGAALLEITNRLFDHEQHAREFLTESRALSLGGLRLVVDSAYHVTSILERFRARFPGIHITMQVGNSNDVISQLSAYEADIGVLGELPHGTDFEVVALGRAPLIGFAAKGSAYENVRLESYREIAQYPLVLREQGSKTRQQLETAAKKSGVRLQATIEAEGREAVREVVASGAGIGFVSMDEFGNDERLVKLPLPKPRPVMAESLICLRERRDQKLIAAFMEKARNAV